MQISSHELTNWNNTRHYTELFDFQTSFWWIANPASQDYLIDACTYVGTVYI